MDIDKTYATKRYQNMPIINRDVANIKYTEKEEKFLRELVVVEFVNNDNENLGTRFIYGKEGIKFIPNKKYKVPRFLIEHFQRSYWPIKEYKPDGTGNMIKTEVGKHNPYILREVYQLCGT